MEDSTRIRPVTLKSGRLEILVATLEKEVVCNQLLLFSFSHACKGIILSLKLAFEAIKNAYNFTFNFSALFLGNTGSKRVVSEVTGNSDSGRVDHLVFISWEVWASELGVIHVDDMLVCWAVTVVFLNNLVKEWSKSVVAVVAASINTDSRVGPLAPREDSLLETESIFVFLVLKLLPNVTGEALRQKRGGSTWEIWVSSDIFSCSQMRSHHATVCAGIGKLLNIKNEEDLLDL